MVLPAGLESKESGVQIQESAASDLSASESTLSLCRSHDVFTLNHTQCLFIIIKKTLLWWLPYVDWDAFSSNQRAWRIAARALCKTLMSTEGKRKEKKKTDFKTLSPPLRVLLQWNYFNHFWSEHQNTHLHQRCQTYGRRAKTGPLGSSIRPSWLMLKVKDCANTAC